MPAREVAQYGELREAAKAFRQPGISGVVVWWSPGPQFRLPKAGPWRLIRRTGSRLARCGMARRRERHERLSETQSAALNIQSTQVEPVFGMCRQIGGRGGGRGGIGASGIRASPGVTGRHRAGRQQRPEQAPAAGPAASRPRSTRAMQAPISPISSHGFIRRM